MHKIISFVISESPRLKKGAVLEQKPLQSAPQYYESAIPHQFAMSEEKAMVGGKEVKFFVRSYPPENFVVEASIEVDDVFSEKAFKLREELINACQKISQKKGGNIGLSEEYSIALVSGYDGDPEQFLNKSEQIAAFLKSEREPLDENEIAYTLASQIKYSQNDMVIVDWDGSFVFDTKGEIDDIVDLLQTANLQLLRYRALDYDLDNKLARINKFTQNPDTKIISFKRKDIESAFQEVIQARSKAIAEFETIDRDIKLIGDWYSARLYGLASKKYKLEEWRRVVKEKLDSLEDIYSIVSENFSISRTHLMELIQIILFFVLQVGWFALIILEIFYYTR
ncbi:MAG: hypothetical protein Q7S83_04090 [bacterium]|nr:hypothetical protein [bacterium]